MISFEFQTNRCQIQCLSAVHCSSSPVYSTQEVLFICDLGNESLSGAVHAFEDHSGFWRVKASYTVCVVLGSGNLHHDKKLSGGQTLFSRGRKSDSRKVFSVFNNPKLPPSVGWESLGPHLKPCCDFVCYLRSDLPDPEKGWSTQDLSVTSATSSVKERTTLYMTWELPSLILNRTRSHWKRWRAWSSSRFTARKVQGSRHDRNIGNDCWHKMFLTFTVDAVSAGTFGKLKVSWIVFLLVRKEHSYRLSLCHII